MKVGFYFDLDTNEMAKQLKSVPQGYKNLEKSLKV